MAALCTELQVGQLQLQPPQVLDRVLDRALHLVLRGSVLAAQRLLEHQRLDLTLQLSEALEAERGCQARHRWLADPDALGQLDARDERSLQALLDDVRGDPPLYRGEAQTIEQI